MYGVEGQESEEGLFVVLFDEVYCFVSKTDRERFALGAVFEVRVLVGREKAPRRRAPMMAAFVDLESMMLGLRSISSEMPLAGEEGAVTAFFEGFGHGGGLSRKVVSVFRREDAVVALPLRAGGCPNPIGDANAGRVLPAHDGSAGGRANLAGRIAIGKAHPRLGKCIDVGSLVKSGALDGEVFDAKIIGKNKNDVGFSQRDERNEEEERERLHLIGGGKRKIETKTIHFGVSAFWGFRQTAGDATDL